MYIDYTKELQKRKRLRKTITPQERILWSRIRSGSLGYKFRRQHSIGRYIADFYCHEALLVIEIDGSQHQVNIEYDKVRSKFFQGLGIQTLRFWNNEINTNLEGVLMKIVEVLETPHP